MRLGIVTLFPEMFNALHYGITGKAIQQKLLQLDFWNPREYAKDKHRTVDDKPYGGGPGMVMKSEPLWAALQAAKQTLGAKTKVIYLSPQGQCLEQKYAKSLSQEENLILISGRYAGIDERIIYLLVNETWSIGDYILSGGELAAMVLIDTMTRLLPGALGDSESAKQDSFSIGLLGFPHYTRPEEVSGIRVPEVLLSGNHRAIQRWRLQQALGRTWLYRPDLLRNYQLDPEQQTLLNEFIREYPSSRS